MKRCLSKVTIQKAFESAAVAGFVASHLVNGVVNGIEALLFGFLSKLEFAHRCAVLGFNAPLEVLFGGIGDDFTQQLGKLSGVLGLFIGGFLPVESDFRIAFAVRNTRHRQIHAYFGAFALEVLAQTLDDFGIDTFGNADNMLGSPRRLPASAFLNLDAGAPHWGHFSGALSPS